jgi:RNA polymerase sigma-70 factor (ECF subfamily)
MQNTRLAALTDADLVDLARGGDKSAFSELVSRHHAACLRHANFLLRDQGEAEDEVQNAVWKAFAHLDKYKATGEFSSWLARIVTNDCLIRLRLRSRARMCSIDGTEDRDGDPIELPCHAEDPEFALIQSQMATVVRREISRIPSLLRNVVLLRDVHMLPMDEVANRLGITVPAAKSRLFRARAELRERVIQSCGRRTYYTMRSCVQQLPARSTRSPVAQA